MRNSKSTYDLFLQALNVTNASMEANRNSVILKPMLDACRNELAGEDFGVEIYEDDPDAPCDYFTIRLKGDTFVLVSHSKPESTSAQWRVSLDYLRDVATHPRRYIDHPALLAFDWLNRRLNVSA